MDYAENDKPSSEELECAKNAVSKNTFGEYQFEEWVPLGVQEQIRNFWGQMGRNYYEWLENGCHDVSQTCSHGPGPNGFKNPPLGAHVMYLVKDWDSMHKLGEENYLYKRIEGRYIHAWNNMGRLVHPDGSHTVVSSCDMWVRVWQSDIEKNLTNKLSPRVTT